MAIAPRDHRWHSGVTKTVAVGAVHAAVRNIRFFGSLTLEPVESAKTYLEIARVTRVFDVAKNVYAGKRSAVPIFGRQKRHENGVKSARVRESVRGVASGFSHPSYPSARRGLPKAASIQLPKTRNDLDTSA